MIPQDYLSDSITNRNAVFFCGAGISRGVEGERGLPGGRELAREMAEKLLGRTVKDNEPLDLKQIAQEMIWENKGRSRLNEYLLKVFANPAIEPLRTHKALAALECNIITTNYDTLIEEAFKKTRKVCRTVVRESDLTRMQDVNVVKIHGCVTNVDNIVIAEEDYYRWLISDSEMKTLVRQWFIQHPIVFIGFSLSDPNFRQLYYDLRLRFGEALKVAYAVFKKKSGNYDMRFIEKQGIEIIEQDATAFLEDLVGQVVLPKALEKYGPMACARMWRDWLDADPKRTQKDLERLIGKSHSRFSDILNLTKLPARYQELVENKIIDYMPATYIRKLRTELEKLGELEKEDDAIYKWAQTKPTLQEAKERYEQSKERAGAR